MRSYIYKKHYISYLLEVQQFIQLSHDRLGSWHCPLKSCIQTSKSKVRTVRPYRHQRSKGYTL
jgi:hypothetical protein